MKKPKTGKRGTISTSVFYSLFNMFFMVLIVMTVVILINLFYITNVDARDAESRITGLSALYSTKGISYYDQELGRIFPGIIDMDKFTDEQINKAINIHDNEFIAAKYTLNTIAGEEIKSVFLNKKWYERWKPLAGYPGAGASQSVILERYVLIKNSEHVRGKLTIEVITPNS